MVAGPDRPQLPGVADDDRGCGSGRPGGDLFQRAHGGDTSPVRQRVSSGSAADIAEALRAHGETFVAARPASTGVVVGLLDPRWLVEIEADAYVERRGA
jgi:hypothetical protein